MSQPVVTILMPVFNGQAFLHDALASIWSQRLDDFELLAVDDGSTDRTPEILAACRDPRLRILRNNTRRRLSEALNRGLDEARGEFIARMDADDLMRRDRLVRQVAFLKSYPEIGLCGGQARTFGDKPRQTLSFPRNPEEIKAFALFYSPFAHPTVMFRRDWFVREGLRYDGAFYPAEDYELWSRAVMRFPCANLSTVLLDYRVHGTSMTCGEWSDMDTQTVHIQRAMLARLGITPTLAESQLHRAASMGKLPSTPESLSLTEAWLLKLNAANLDCNVYDQGALAEVLNYVWFRTAMAVVRDMGDAARQAYHASRLAKMGSRALQHRVTVRFAALKAEIMGLRG